MRHWYATLNKKNLVATSVGLIALCGLDAVLIFSFAPELGRGFLSMVCYSVTVSIALYFWIGKGAEELGVDSWLGWLCMFVIGALFSILFVAIGCDWRNPFIDETVSCTPRFSLTWTMCALALTIIALPGALRAWLLKR